MIQTCLNAAELRHICAATHCQCCPECATGTPTDWVSGQDKAPTRVAALRRFLLVSLTSVLNPSLSLRSPTQPNLVSLTSVLNSSSPSEPYCWSLNACTRLQPLLESLRVIPLSHGFQTNA